MNARRVFLVHAHPVVREGLKTMINADGEMEVAGEAAADDSALFDIISSRPEIVVMDASDLEYFLETVSLFQKADAGYKVLGLADDIDRRIVQLVVDAGASGYVLLRSPTEELVNALKAVAEGRCYLDPLFAPAKNDLSPDHGGDDEEAAAIDRSSPSSAGLSRRGVEVLQLVALGYNNKEIAAKLQVSVKTIETHKSRSLKKLGIRSRAEVVRYAASQGWQAIEATAISGERPRRTRATTASQVGPDEVASVSPHPAHSFWSLNDERDAGLPSGREPP